MNQTPDRFDLLPSLQSESDERAAVVLAAYYRPLTGTAAGYTGGRFDTFDPSGTRSASANTITSDDLMALSLLSITVPARAALQVLVDQRRRFEALLEALGPDRDFAHEPSVDQQDFRSAWELWRALRCIHDFGPTTVSKLMARKRPRLIPIYDSVIDRSVLGGSGVLWRPLHSALRADDFALHHRLLRVRALAGVDESVSALRVFDVLAWMDGSGESDKILKAPASSQHQPPARLVLDRP
ncbi:DUF6308 family protein [Ornithinimicrobium cerasi]|uniref:DUF6308 family protein n=1 Tax=Ornithinimicrobium cerasi TaxID=2248773 RepID=UPI0011450840|nr:DUF6308 family protein [Ornithinimicrobium cerasi]